MKHAAADDAARPRRRPGRRDREAMPRECAGCGDSWARSRRRCVVSRSVAGWALRERVAYRDGEAMSLEGDRL
jgi:hypothetical protein